MLNAPATELTQAEKAAAWDRYISLKQAHDSNEREIEDRYNKRYELQRLIDNNYKVHDGPGRAVGPALPWLRLRGLQLRTNLLISKGNN
jgi:hypothetical protein